MKLRLLIVFLLAGLGLSAQSKRDSLAKAFAAATNDSLFIAQNSLNKFHRYDITRKKPQQPAADETVGMDIFNAQKGQVLGPYGGKKLWRYYKIVSVDSATVINVRHILIDKSLHDSIYCDTTAQHIMRWLTNGKRFDEVCEEYSDPGSGTKTGSCDLFNQYAEEFVPPFAEACRQHKAGAIFRVRSQFGEHIVEVVKDPLRERKSVRYVVLDLPVK